MVICAEAATFRLVVQQQGCVSFGDTGCRVGLAALAKCQKLFMPRLIGPIEPKQPCPMLHLGLSKEAITVLIAKSEQTLLKHPSLGKVSNLLLECDPILSTHFAKDF